MKTQHNPSPDWRLFLICVALLIIISLLPACTGGGVDPTPTPAPGRTLPLCGNHNILCK